MMIVHKNPWRNIKSYLYFPLFFFPHKKIATKLDEILPVESMMCFLENFQITDEFLFKLSELRSNRELFQATWFGVRLLQDPMQPVQVPDQSAGVELTRYP